MSIRFIQPDVNPYAGLFSLIGGIMGDNARQRNQAGIADTLTKVNTWQPEQQGLLSQPIAQQPNDWSDAGMRNAMPQPAPVATTPTPEPQAKPMQSLIAPDKNKIKAGFNKDYALAMKELVGKRGMNALEAKKMLDGEVGTRVDGMYNDQLKEYNNHIATKLTDQLGKAKTLKEATTIAIAMDRNGIKSHPELIKAAWADPDYSIQAHGAELIAVNKKNPNDKIRLADGKKMSEYEEATIANQRERNEITREGNYLSANNRNNKQTKDHYGITGDLTKKEAEYEQLRGLAQQAISSGDLDSAAEYLDEIGKQFTDPEIGQIAQSDHYSLNNEMGKQYQSANGGKYDYTYGTTR